MNPASERRRVYDAPRRTFPRLAAGLARRDHGPTERLPHGGRGLMTFLRRLHRDDAGATTTEYILILALIVLPIALMFPMFMQMVKTYGGRMTQMMGLPFP